MKNIDIKREVFDTLENWTTYKNEILLDGKKVGTAYTMINLEDDSEVYLEDIGIEEEFRNRGIGTHVIKTLAGEYGFLYFAPTDENNKRLYERIAEEYIGGPEVDQGFGVYYLE